MSFYTSRILSYYPEKFKMRKDESSNGFKIFSSFSDIFENIYYENYSMRRFMTFHNKVKQIESLWEINLEKNDRPSDILKYPLPLVFSNNKRLDFSKSFVDFLYREPDDFEIKKEIEVKDWLIYDSSNPNVFNDIKEAEHLMIDVTKLGDFLEGGNLDQKNYEFFYNYYISIKGFDELYNPIEENVFITEKECVLTKKTFKEVTFVDHDGFDGTYKIYLSGKKQEYKKEILEHNYIHFLDNLRNLKISIYKDPNTNISYLRYEAMLFRNAISYARSASMEIQKDQFLLDQVLLDENNNYINAIDFTIDSKNQLLYVLGKYNKIFCYKMELHSIKKFKNPSSNSNFLTYLDLENRAGLFEDISFCLNFKNYIAGIQDYYISRIDPDGIKTYYQSDGSWNNSLHSFQFNLDLGKQERLKQIKFDNYFDKIGQWEFSVEVKYEEFKEREIATTGVYCEFLKCKNSYDLSSNSNIFDGIFMNKENVLTVSSNNLYYCLEEKSNKFTYNPLVGQILLKNEFDEIEVILPTEISFRGERNIYKSLLNNEEKDTIYLKKGERHCFVQESKMNNDFPLIFSIFGNRDIALVEQKINVDYYINEVKSTENEYLNRLNAGDYDIIEIVVPAVENDNIYCYSKNHSEICIKINFIENDIFERLNENNGYL